MKTRLAVLAFLFAAVPSRAVASDAFVTLTRTAFDPQNLPTNTRTITAEDIEQTHAQNVAEVLEKETPFFVARNGERGSLQTVNIRGFSSASRVLILIDGRPVRDVFTGSVDLSQIPADALERIEVVEGPSSALYGANAEGGVINVITRRAIATTPQAAATAQTGSYWSDLFRLQVAQKSGPVDVYAAGSRSYAGAFRDNADFANYSADSTIGVDERGFGRTEIQGSFVQGNVGTPGGVNFPPEQFNGDLEKAALFPDQRQQDRDRAVRIEQNTPIGQDAHLVGRFFWNQHDRNFYGAGFTAPSEGFDQGVELQGQLPLGFVVGGQWETQWYSDPFNPFYSTDIWSGYAQQTQRWTDRLTSIVGVRGDHDSNFGKSVNPRATLIYQAAPWLKWSANGARAFRAPTFADLFPAPDTFNGEIQPEVTWSVDTGVEIRPKDTIVGRLTFFDAETSDRILVNPNTFAAENLQRSFSRGVEADYRQQLVGHLQQLADYTFTEARGKTNGMDAYIDLPLTPRHRAQYALDFAPPEGVQARSQWQYIGENYFPLLDGSDRTVLRETFLWNVRLGYRRHAWELFFNVDNLLNRRYVLNANPPGSFLGQYYPQPGRTFVGGVTLRFWGK